MPTIPAALSPIPCQRTTGVGASWARAWAVTNSIKTALIALNQTIRVRILTQSVVQIKVVVHKDNVLFYLTCVSLRKPYKKAWKLYMAAVCSDLKGPFNWSLSSANLHGTYSKYFG